jgi:phosphoribosylglycinamide formyltransferase-1
MRFMKISDPLIIFGYAFPHRKTYDFITVLFALGFKNITVIGAPKVELASSKTVKDGVSSDQNAYCVKTLCRSLGIKFEVCAHDNFDKISKINNRLQAHTAIISGARIIKKEVINLFSSGIVNFHPGKIPETSGLDSFHHAIRKNCSMGVTVHVIDHKVDRGSFIFFEKLRVSSGQSMEVVKENLYGVQLVALRKYIKTYFGKTFIYPEINRPKKNSPLEETEIQSIAEKFPEWLTDRVKDQEKVEKHFFVLCINGDLEGIKAMIESDSYLLNCRSPEGWSAIIIASFWQRFNLVEYFLKLGANPNDYGFNGTTVLMYAKTKLLERSDADISLLKLLLDAGASMSCKDNYGKNIFDYLNMDVASERRIAKFLTAYGDDQQYE